MNGMDLKQGAMFFEPVILPKTPKTFFSAWYNPSTPKALQVGSDHIKALKEAEPGSNKNAFLPRIRDLKIASQDDFGFASD